MFQSAHDGVNLCFCGRLRGFELVKDQQEDAERASFTFPVVLFDFTPLKNKENSHTLMNMYVYGV